MSTTTTNQPSNQPTNQPTIWGRRSLSIAKNHPKPSQEFSEQFGPSIRKMKGFSRNSPERVHPNFAENLGRQILGNTFSVLKTTTNNHKQTTTHQHTSRAAKRGGFKRGGGGFPIWTCPSFSVLSCPFWDFPDFSEIFPVCSGMVRRFSRSVIFLFLGLSRAPTRTSPEREIGPFPQKVGNPGLEPPWFSFSQIQQQSASPKVSHKRVFTLIG